MSFPTLTVETSIDAATWEQQPSCHPAGELGFGLPPIIGSATIVQRLPGSGPAYQPDATPIASTPALPIGILVRVMATTGYDDTGTAQQSERWRGVITDMLPTPDGDKRVYACQELGYLLDQFRAPAGLVGNGLPLDGSGGDPIYLLDDWPIFNPGGIGNRSENTITIAGQAVYYCQPGSGILWTAADLAAVYLAQLNEVAVANAPDATPWLFLDAIGTEEAPSAAALRAAEWDLRGKTVWQILCILFSGQCPWFILPGEDDTTVFISNGTDRTVDGSPRSVILNRYRDGRAGQVDELSLRSTERPLNTITLYAVADGSGSLEHDWTAADESARRTDPTKPDYAHVYTRFRLASDWDGTCSDGSTSGPGIRSTTDDNGTRQWVSGLELPRRELFEFVPGAAILNADGLPELTSPGVWLGTTDITEHCTVTVDRDINGPVVEIIYFPPNGGAGADAIRRALLDGKALVLTIGVYEPSHRLVRWAATSTPRAVPRTLRLSRPAREWYVCPNARLRSTWNSATGSIVDEGNLVAYRDWLVAERHGEASPAAEVDLTIEGTIDIWDTSMPWPGDRLTLTKTKLGTIGPVRVLRRNLIIADPRQATRLVCGRDTASPEART